MKQYLIYYLALILLAGCAHKPIDKKIWQYDHPYKTEDTGKSITLQEGDSVSIDTKNNTYEYLPLQGSPQELIDGQMFLFQIQGSSGQW